LGTTHKSRRQRRQHLRQTHSVDRGFTGHEHLQTVGLIHMNGRLYDPALHHFLQPDNYVQDPFNTQNFNRYGYCLNNPLVYVDENGEFLLGTIFTHMWETVENVFTHGVNFHHYSYEKTERAWEIDKGMFTGDFGQILNKWTWGAVNTLAGNFLGQELNRWGFVDNVTHLDGAVALSGVNSEGRAFTIGNYIFGPDNFKADWKDHLFVHEYGHYIQSQYFGALYLPIIATTSLASTQKIGGSDHSTRWFEVQASKMGAEHFDRLYGSGAKGYKKGSSDFFDKESFVNGKWSPYINPRLGSSYQGRKGNPIDGARFTGWDVAVPILTPIVISTVLKLVF